MIQTNTLPANLSAPIRLLHFIGSSSATQLKILHVGAMSSAMKVYLIKNKIQHYPISPPLLDQDIDLILLNGVNSYDKTLSGSLKNIRPIVTYKQNHKVNPSKDEIPFVLIPILVKYLIKLKESLSSMSRKRAYDSSDRFLHRLTATIDEHLDDHTLSIKKLSKLIFMSRSSFSKKIKSYTGLKPTEFINQYKLEKSKHLLTLTNWQIGKISDHLGFCSQQYYCRLFKQLEGVNPSEFRRVYRNTGIIAN